MLYMHRDRQFQSEPLGYTGSFDHVANEVRGEILACRSAHARLFDFCTQLNEQRHWPPGTATSVALNLIRWHKLRAEYSSSLLEHQSVCTIAEATRAADAPNATDLVA